MIRFNLIIAGAERNVEPYIDQIFENTDQISKLFSKVKIVLVESDSDEYRYLLVIDMDDICAHKIKDELILSNFEYDNWDMITANQSDNYYDMWGLKHDEWMPYDCWKMVEKRPSFCLRQVLSGSGCPHKWHERYARPPRLHEVDLL